MPEKPPLTAAGYAQWLRQEPMPTRRRVGRPYIGAVKDRTVLRMVGAHLAKQFESGVTHPSIRRAAISLAKKFPFNVWGMKWETIRGRHKKMLERLRRGEGLQPELQRLEQEYSKQLVNSIQRKQAKQYE